MPRPLLTNKFLIDETGAEYGKLMVIERMHNTGSNGSRYRCECECGREVFAKGQHLRNGTKTCCSWCKTNKGGA
jgi:hypothetical protein